MSTRNFCDYPNCQREATTRIIEEPYSDSGFIPELMGTTLRGGALDACDEHRAVTHAGWWCMDHEEVLRRQAARKDAA